MKIEQLISYPLKSGCGVTAESLLGGASGIDGDREFCLYRKSDNKFISMRDNIRIADILMVPDGNMLAVKTADDMFYFDISGTEKNTIRIWSRNVDVTVMPPDVSAFISSVIGEEVVLARLRHPGDYSQSFMDTGPIHIISLAALTGLSLVTGYKSINPLVFRPNIIVPDFADTSEDNVESLTINGIRFVVTERTERCSAVSLQHRKVHGLDSSALLEKIDEANDYDGALFGLYLQAQDRFQINVGDQVTVS